MEILVVFTDSNDKEANEEKRKKHILFCQLPYSASDIENILPNFHFHVFPF